MINPLDKILKLLKIKEKQKPSIEENNLQHVNMTEQEIINLVSEQNNTIDLLINSNNELIKINTEQLSIIKEQKEVIKELDILNEHLLKTNLNNRNIYENSWN